MAYNRSEDAE